MIKEKIIDQYANPESENHKADSFGHLIDLAFSEKDLGLLNQLETEKDKINISNLDDFHLTTYYYDLSNLYSSIHQIEKRNVSEKWEFDDDLIKKQIYNLRKSISLEGFNKIVKERQCQIFTNLGNSLNLLGRCIEAQEQWDNSLKIIDHFPMTLGNKANGLISYSLYLPRDENQMLFLNQAYKNIRLSLDLNKYLEPGASNFFKSIMEYLEANIPEYIIKKDVEFYKKQLRFNDKSNYCFWINRNKLLLSPLNDLSSQGEFKSDEILLPPIVMPKESQPKYHILFNQIKQEYCSARYNLFLFTTSKKNHFSDNDVILPNCNDLFQYSYRTELLKNSFKTFYSIFDKIGYFINDYISLKIKPNKVSFRNIWYTNYEKGEINQIFNTKTNWPMRALFWVSKDLFDKEFEDTMEPEARFINQLRNYMEHKSLIIANVPFDERIENDVYNYVIGDTDLLNKTIKIAKLVREAIMYLCFAVDQIEREYNPENLQFERVEYNKLKDK